MNTTYIFVRRSTLFVGKMQYLL